MKTLLTVLFKGALIYIVIPAALFIEACREILMGDRP